MAETTPVHKQRRPYAERHYRFVARPHADCVVDDESALYHRGPISRDIASLLSTQLRQLGLGILHHHPADPTAHLLTVFAFRSSTATSPKERELEEGSVHMITPTPFCILIRQNSSPLSFQVIGSLPDDYTETHLEPSQVEALRTMTGELVAERHLAKTKPTLIAAVQHATRMLSDRVGEFPQLLPLRAYREPGVFAPRVLHYDSTLERWHCSSETTAPGDATHLYDADDEVNAQLSRIHHERIGRAAAESVLSGRPVGTAVLRRRKSSKRSHVLSFVHSTSAGETATTTRATTATTAVHATASTSGSQPSSVIQHHLVKETPRTPTLPHRLPRPRYSTEEGFGGSCLLDVIAMLEDHYDVTFCFVPVDPKQPFELGTIQKDTFSVLTYNVWFAQLASESRALAILEFVSERDPDLVAFQEATPRFIRYLQESAMVRERYYLSERNLLGPGYGTLLMCKQRPLSFLCYDRFRSSQARDLLLAVYRLRGGRQRMLTATVHLESNPPRAVFRAMQLDVAFEVLCKTHSLFMGDMNMDPDSPENESVPDAVLDVWPNLHPDRIGYTEDSHVNHMRYLAKHEHGQRRIDRIFLHSSHITPIRMEILGDRPLQESQVLEHERSIDRDTGKPMLIFPSDHQGLYAEFTLMR